MSDDLVVLEVLSFDDEDQLRILAEYAETHFQLTNGKHRFEFTKEGMTEAHGDDRLGEAVILKPPE